MGNYDKTQDIEKLEEELKRVTTEKEEEVQIRTSNKKKNFNKLRIKYKKSKKQYLVMLLGLFVAISSIIGTSYAYLTYVSKTNNSTIITAGTLALILQNEENVISIENALPTKDEEGLAQETEYSFEVKNNGTIPESYKITLNNTCTVSGDVTVCIPDEYIKVGLKVGNNDYKIIEKNENNEFIIDTGDLGKGQVQKYKMKIWLAYNTPSTYNAATGIVQYSGQLGISYAQSTAKVWNYDYTGAVQKFIAPYAGEYKIELWGAQGGNYNTTTYEGGKGAYTVGTINLEKRRTLFIYVGQQPANTSTPAGGYNGGGTCPSEKDADGRTGGGATDIRVTSGEWNDSASLASRIMVAAGGGGASYESDSWYSNGGAGGKLTGLIPTVMSNNAATYYGTGGTQTTGGTHHQTGPSERIVAGMDVTGAFGIGGSGISTDGGAGGGSGYYGGGGTSWASGGGGGSSYISGYQGCIAITGENDLTAKCTQNVANSDITCSYHYSTLKFTSPDMKAGNEEMPTHNGLSTMTGNSGNGYAKITFLKKPTNNS